MRAVGLPEAVLRLTTANYSTTVENVAKSESMAFVYPDYDLTVIDGGVTELYYDFSITRKDHWGVLRDWISLPRDAIAKGYTSDDI